MIGQNFPLPNIENILDQLGKSVYFSTLDLASGFYQIQVKESDKRKTAFTTPSGHYEFNNMPMGMRNSPATFARLMNIVLSGLQGSKCFCYLDDIIVYGTSLEDHNRKLIDVLKQLDIHNLKLQPDKCEFLHTEITYLGHLISDKGVKPDPKRVEAISKYDKLISAKQVKSFLGVAGYYRKFIKNFSGIAKPLTNLLKKNVKFIWTDKCQESFDDLKRALTSEPILQFPRFNEKFILTTDSSNDAIGAVLSQGGIGNDLPISYFSRTLNKSQMNFSTTEKELLAIVEACKHYRCYLYGQTFDIVCDHKPLQWLHNCKDPSSRLLRWRLKLLDYEYEIHYKKGKHNTNADGLSRLHQVNRVDEEDLTFEYFKSFHQREIRIPEPNKINLALNKIPNLVIPLSCDLSQNNEYIEYVQNNVPDIIPSNHKLTDVIMKTILQQNLYLIFIKEFNNDSANYETLFETLYNLRTVLKHNQVKSFIIPDISLNNSIIQQNTFYSLLYFLFSDFKYEILHKERIFIDDKELIQQILKENHDTKTSGHQGFERTYERIKEQFYWDNMKNDIRNYIRQCDICQKSKTDFISNKSPMLITTTSNKFCEQIALDVVGPLPQTVTGNRFILTLQDDLTKFIQAYALPNHEAATVAIFFLKFCTQFGFPINILKDQGTEFTSKVFKEINKLMSIKHKITSPYHPQSNGSLERTHLTLKDYFKCYVNKDTNNWDEFLNFAVYSYNTGIHKSTQKTPYELVFGEIARIPNYLNKPKDKPNYSNLANDIAKKLRIVRENAKENLIKAKTKSKQQYDRTHNRTYEFKENNLVLLLDKQSKSKNKKLAKNYLGPFRIIQIHNNNTATIEIKNQLRTYHLDLLKPYVVTDNGKSENKSSSPSNNSNNHNNNDANQPSTSGCTKHI